jgi:uncharacterized YigZ family protein
MKDLYRTIQFSSEGVYREKGSKFLAFAYPVATEDEIRARLEGLRRRFHDARHHCFAWRLGADMEHYRVNDDGEPSNSAGQPIFGQIQSRELTHILVVVVRYFGGTPLGVGGLRNAYRSAASDALDGTRIIEKRVYVTFKLEFGYELMNAVMTAVKELQLEYYDQQFDLQCTLMLKAWKRLEKRVKNRFSHLSGCTITCTE